MWALIQDGRVVELTDVDPAGRFHPEFVWKPALIGVELGTLYEDGHYSQPPGPTPVQTRDAKLAEINAAFDGEVSTLTGAYPEGERLTWPIQQAEALAWQADNTLPTPYLDGLAAVRGIEPSEMRQKTVTQTTAFIAASQLLVGKRQRLRDQVDAVDLTTENAIGQISAITWD